MLTNGRQLNTARLSMLTNGRQLNTARLSAPRAARAAPGTPVSVVLRWEVGGQLSLE